MFAPLPLKNVNVCICKNEFYIHIWETPYDKILKTPVYFSYIDINPLFLLNNLLLYIQNIIQCLLDEYKVNEIEF